MKIEYTSVTGTTTEVEVDESIGSKGRDHFKPRAYTANNGEERQANDVDRFYDYDPKNFPEEDEWMKIPDGADELPFN